MKQPRHSVAAVIAAALLVGLTACGSPAANTGSGTQAEDQFFRDRGGTVVAGNPSGSPFPMPSGSNVTNETRPFPTPGGDNAGMQNMPLIGTVDRVNGRTITIKSPDGSTTTVELTGDAKIQKDAEGQISDLQKGVSITAFGKKSGDVVQTDQVHIGGAGMAMGASIISGGLAGPGGNPADGPPQPVAGTVEDVQGQTLTVKGSDGSTTTVELSANVKVYKQTEAQPSDLAAGTTIMVQGTKNGDVFQATSVKVINAIAP
jgi:preprotein translocase subunit YajC